MSDVNLNSDFIQIATIDMFIERQDDAKMSTSTIGTDALGPCICFILDFTYEITQKCIMHHYSYHHAEEDKSRLEILEWLL